MALSVAALSGCSASFTDGGNMMRPPRPTGDKAEIQNIIEEKAGSGFIFVYPQSGDYRSAVTMQDLDNDGSDEAIALFSSGGENTKLNLMIMTKKGESWESVANIQSSAAGVDRMFFADINGDSKLELFIGWTSFGSNEKQISAYAFDDEHNQIREMPIDSTYNELACADFDNDNQSELILLTIANKDDGSLAKFFKYSTNEKRPMLSSSVPLDAELTRILNACVGMVDSNTRALI
ncbi:VCBS repeat-containing protein, partial [Pseudoruminococcus massiliensis]